MLLFVCVDAAKGGNGEKNKNVDERIKEAVQAKMYRDTAAARQAGLKLGPWKLLAKEQMTHKQHLLFMMDGLMVDSAFLANTVGKFEKEGHKNARALRIVKMDLADDTKQLDSLRSQFGQADDKATAGYKLKLEMVFIAEDASEAVKFFLYVDTAYQLYKYKGQDEE